MPTLSETFEKRVLKTDAVKTAEQRTAIIESMFAEIEQINAALEAANSGTRFRFRCGRGGSVQSYQLRYEAGFVNNSGVRCASHIMYIEFPLRAAEIVICKDDWGELPNIKTDPDEVFSVFSLDAAQAARDIMVDDMMNALSDKDKYELKVYFRGKNHEQQGATPK